MQCYVRQLAESWLSRLEPIIKTITDTYFANNPKRYNAADVQTLIEGSQAIRRLTNEVNEQLAIMANATKIVFSQVIKYCAVEKAINLATLSLDELGLSKIKLNIDQIAESLKITCEDIRNIVQELNEDTSSSDNLAIGVQKFLKEKFKLLVNFVFIDPTIKLTSAFLESCRKHPQLATMFAFHEVDNDLKKAISEFTVSTQQKKNAEFLIDQLRQTVTDMIKSNPDNKQLLRFAVKLGCPLPVAAIKHIADAAHLILADNNYGAGFQVFVYTKDANFEAKQPFLTFVTKKGGKLCVELRCINDQFFICRADSIKYPGIDSINDCFFYESFIKKMTHRKYCFPKHELSFRELLLQKL